MGGSRRVVDQVRLRLQCLNPACPLGSWTLYEPGGYPCRTFTPAVATLAVAELATLSGATLTSVARHWQCDRRTVARWQTWVAGLGDPGSLVQLCCWLDPTGLPPPRNPSSLALLARAGFLVLLLEHLARLLRDRGVPLEPGP